MFFDGLVCGSVKTLVKAGLISRSTGGLLVGLWVKPSALRIISESALVKAFALCTRSLKLVVSKGILLDLEAIAREMMGSDVALCWFKFSITERATSERSVWWCLLDNGVPSGERLGDPKPKMSSSIARID